MQGAFARTLKMNAKLLGSAVCLHLGKIGIAAKREKSEWNNDYLIEVLSGF